MRTEIVSAFPCCGKTYAFEHFQNKYKMLDSDSSQFSWMMVKDEHYEMQHRGEKDYKARMIKIRNPDFPNNYIEHIKENIGEVEIIFVSSHEVVRKAMTDAGIYFKCVYPKPDMLNEWVGRMYRRGNDDSFIQFIIKNWDSFMHEIIFGDYRGKGVMRLGNNEYIDVDVAYNW